MGSNPTLSANFKKLLGIGAFFVSAQSAAEPSLAARIAFTVPATDANGAWKAAGPDLAVLGAQAGAARFNRS